MTKMTEGSKTKTAVDDLHPQDDSVGALLRAARLARNLSIEEVSAALRIRHVQLRAIEENNLEELPGITYAVGFVRSYANYLGLNGAEIVDKFKAEHGYAPSQSKLSFPEPVSEGRVPDPIMIGAGFFLAVLVLVFWTVYSNVNSGSSKDAEQIPPAPVSETMTGGSPEIPSAQTEALPLATEPAVAPVPATAPAPETVLAPIPAMIPETAASPDNSSKTQDVSAGAKMPDETPASETVSAAGANKEMPKADEPQIKIKRGKSRVTIEASESSWVEISNADGEVIYKKVMRPGDRYFVPDEPGLKLVTSNAGGLEISVDGKSVDSIGDSGEIVRGVSLNPASIKKKKYMFRN